MASTAAGVAVGSTVGHGLSSMLFGGGGSSHQQVAEAPAAPVEQQTFQQARMGGACEVQAKGESLCSLALHRRALLEPRGRVLHLDPESTCVERGVVVHMSTRDKKLTLSSLAPADFVSCLNATGNDAQSCAYYLDMLKQCQTAAAPY